MPLREALYKPLLSKASHYKRDKEIRKGNIAAHGCKIYIEKTLITLSTNTVHTIDNFGIFPIYLSSKKLLRPTGRSRVIKVA